MTATRILLAGAAGTEAGRHHQRDMFVPAIAASDCLEVCGVWPGTRGSDGFDRAAELADQLGIPLHTELPGALSDADAVVACVDGNSMDALLEAAPQKPVVVDKLALLGTSRLHELVRDPRAATVRAAYHSRFHPSVAALAAAAQAGEFGLPHALHAELFVPYGDGPAAGGDLRHVGILALDAVAAVLGPPRGAVHAVRFVGAAEGGETWTLTIQWRPGVVVTILVSRAAPGVPSGLHRYRLLAADGQALVDLAAPSIQLLGTATSYEYGPGIVQSELETLTRGGGGASAADIARLAALMDAAEASAKDGKTHVF